MANTPVTLLPENHNIYKYFTNFTQAYEIGPDKFCYTRYGPEILDKLKNFQAKFDDVYVVTFPKTGTTWMQEIVYLLMNDLDVDKARKVVKDDAFPYIDVNAWENDNIPDHIQIVNSLPSPRLIKSHMNYSFLPRDILNKKCKIIYVSRNAKDTAVSFYHFACGIASAKFQGSIEDFVHLFLENKVPYAPFITHVKEFWERRNDENIYFTTYEEMQKDMKKVIREVASFLGKPISDDGIKVVANHCSFENMKNNPGANKCDWSKLGFAWRDDFKFMRKGITGDWKNELSPELIKKFDQWIEEGTCNTPGLREIL